MTGNSARPIPFGVRYLRVRLDGTLDDLHRALAYLHADTCDRGRCTPAGMCSRHEQREERRRQRPQGGGSP